MGSRALIWLSKAQILFPNMESYIRVGIHYDPNSEQNFRNRGTSCVSCSCSRLCSGQVLSLTETCQNCYLKSRGRVPWYRSGDLDPSDLWDLDFDLDLQFSPDRDIGLTGIRSI